jgi:sugar/nucleoside kinase (ribokinase family)
MRSDRRSAGSSSKSPGASSRPRLSVYGDINLDIIVLHREEVALGSDSRARIVPSPGGSAANVALWAARLGAEVGFFGQVGDDPVGRQLRAGLASEGVAVEPPTGSLLLAPGAPTGIIIVNVQGGERSMMTDRGANLTVPAGLVPEEALAATDWFHLTGYSLFEPGPREAALNALALCRRLGRPFSVDPSSYRLLREHGPDRFLADIQGAAALFPNHDEALELTGLADPREAAPALADRLERGRSKASEPVVVVVKLGAAGCLVAAAGRVEAVPAAPTGRRGEAGAREDPTGAGDAFAAGFLRDYLSAGARASYAVRAARAGAGAAARVVAVIGAWG